MTLKPYLGSLFFIAVLGMTACVTSSPQTSLASQANADLATDAAQTEDPNRPMFEINYVRGEIICKKKQKILGTGFNREICATQKEWDEYAADTRALNRGEGTF